LSEPEFEDCSALALFPEEESYGVTVVVVAVNVEVTV
jgi:hypothetical protein